MSVCMKTSYFHMISEGFGNVYTKDQIYVGAFTTFACRIYQVIEIYTEMLLTKINYLFVLLSIEMYQSPTADLQNYQS